jgi:AAHS family 4-hydroxybenzoate transporter-like MFS transporter
MKQTVALDVRQFLDEHPLSNFQILAATMCGAIAFMDGYDVQAMGFVAPALSAALHIPRAALGPLLSSGTIGMMFGAITCGTLADRFGRKPILIACTLIFGVMSLITATADSLQTMWVYRFLTGFGLGGAMPNTIALTAEYAPKKYRSVAITTMFCGFSIGAAVGGFVAAGLISSFGWQAVFVVGGLIPLVTAALSFSFLPESIRFLLLKGGQKDRAMKYLSKISRDSDHYDEIVAGADDHASGGNSVKQLFTEGRTLATPLLWVCFFMNLLVLFFLNNWLPTLMNDAGIKVETAIMITTLFQIAGTIGAIFLGWLFDRGFSFRTLALAYVGAALSVILIGQSGVSIGLLMVTVTAAGFCIVGGQTGSQALVANYYPTAIRSTGVGWCHGVGRIGSIVGPILGGMLLTTGVHASSVFWVIAVPSLIAMGAALGVASIKRSVRN